MKRVAVAVLLLAVVCVAACGDEPAQPAIDVPPEDDRWIYEADEDVTSLQSDFDATWAAWDDASGRIPRLTTTIDRHTSQARLDAFTLATDKLGACKESLDAAGRTFYMLAGITGSVASPRAPPPTREEAARLKNVLHGQLRSARLELDAGLVALRNLD